MVMSTPLDLALAHQAARDRVTDGSVRRALRLWREVDPQQLDLGWELTRSRLTGVVVAGQLEAARQAETFTARVDRFYGASTAERLVPEAFTNVMLDGRELEPALFGAVTTAKTLTPTYGARNAFEVAASFLATVVGSAVSDMGRQADMVSSVGRRRIRYIRVLSPGACSRCAVLAGKGEYATVFLRHPRCRCTSFPIGGGLTPAPGFFDNPSDYFESLSRAQQDRTFTRAGAEAIRNGADINKVVNARRGAYGIGYSGHYYTSVGVNRLQPLTIGVRADGSPLRVFATTEGTTRRGQFGRNNFTGSGRRTTTVRLMPEQISVMAGGDPERWVKLLTRYGYLQ